MSDDRYLNEYEPADRTTSERSPRFRKRRIRDTAPRLQQGKELLVGPPVPTEWWIEGMIGRVPNYNSNFWRLPGEEKQKAMDAFSKGGVDEARRQGFEFNETPYFPAGPVPAFLTEALRTMADPIEGIADLVKKIPGVPDFEFDLTSDKALPHAREGGALAPFAGELTGETIKYMSLYKLFGKAGVTGRSADALVGATSGVLREGSLEGAAIEGGAAATIGKFISVLRTGKGATKSSTAEAMPDAGAVPAASTLTPVEEKVLLPIYNLSGGEQAVILNHFGYSPEIARSLSKTWNGVVDKVAAKAVSKIPPKISEWIHRKFVGSADPRAKAILAGARQRQAEGIDEAIQLGADIRAIPKEFHMEITKYLDPELAPYLTAKGQSVSELGILPPQYMSIVKNAQKKIEDLGREAVEFGLLDAKTFEKRAGEYLARYYKPKDWMVQTVSRKLKNLFVKGERFKKRTLTPEQAVQKGVITDPTYAVSRTIADLTYDIETARAFRAISQNPEWARPYETFGTVQEAKAAGFRAIPKDARYGDLKGMWAQRDIADEIFAIHRPSATGTTGALISFYEKSLGLWKLGKTAWSPSTQGRNYFSNLILADIGAGLSPARQDIYAKALRDYLKKGALYQEAAPTGLFGTDWFGAEIGSLYKPSGVAKSGSMFDLLAHSLPSRALRTPGRIYQGTEHWFKLAVFSHQRSLGASVEAASAHAQKYLFNYSDLSPFLRKLRLAPWGGPFLSFTAKALPVVLESAVRRPIRFWKYPIMLKTMHEYSKAKLGIDDEEWNRINASLPEWRQNGWNVLVPARGREGRPRLIDLTYNLPWGQIGETTSLLKHVPVLKDIPFAGVLDPFIGSNPFTNLTVDILSNRNRFLDKPLYDKRVDLKMEGRVVPKGAGGQATENILGHIGRQLAPGIALAAPDVADAIADKPTKYGDKLDRIGVILNKLVGIKITDVDVERGLRIKVGEWKKDRKAYTSRVFGIEARRDKFDKNLKKGIITQEQHDSFMVDYERELSQLKPLEELLEQRGEELQRLYKDEKSNRRGGR